MKRPLEVIEHTWIPLADGCRLSVRLWLPDRRPAPVVLEYIPYRKRDLYRAHDDAWGAVLAAAGFAFARVDVRGTGDSEGVLTDEYTDEEIEDGLTCIDWLAHQPWCDGGVGMRGISWGGINTLLVAARQPPALRGILPIAATENRFTDDAHYHGGLLGRAQVQWGALFKVVMAGPPDPQVVGPPWRDMWHQRLAATPAIVGRWMRHSHFDDYWSRGIEAPLQIRCPVLFAAGFADPYAQPVWRLAHRLGAASLFGPWGHVYPEMGGVDGLDWSAVEIAWWRHCFFEGEAPVPRGTARVWVAGEFLDVPAQQNTLSLSADDAGDLRPQPASPAVGWPVPDTLVGTATPEWLDRPPLQQQEDDAESLCFDSEPLERDLWLAGQPLLQLDGQTAPVFVRLCEVSANGMSRLVSSAVLEPGGVGLRPLRVAGHRFPAGSRLRVAVSTPPWPMVWRGTAWPRQRVTALALQLPTVQGHNRPLSSEVPAARNQNLERDGARVAYRIDEPDFSWEAGDSGTTLSGSSQAEASVRANEPHSGRWYQRISRRWQRGEWRCEVYAEVEITSDTDGLRVRERLDAWEDGARVASHEHNTVVPSGGENEPDGTPVRG